MDGSRTNAGQMTFAEKFRSRKVQRYLVIVTFMFVPLLLLLVFTYIPFAKMVQFSFYDMKYIGAKTYVGLKNYIDVFKRSDIFGSLFVSVYYMGGAVLQLALALFFATMMVFKVKGESVFKAAMFFPYLVCGIAATLEYFLYPCLMPAVLYQGQNPLHRRI